MSKKKTEPPDDKKPGRGRPSEGGRKPRYTVYARIDQVIGEALEQYIEEARPKTSLTAVVELALQQYLQGVGYLPSADE